MSALGDSIGKYFPLLRRKPKIERKDVLAIVPVRNSAVTWERVGDKVLITVPLRNDGLAKIVKRLMKNLPDSRKIELDNVGSRVWELCNGERNLNLVIDSISKEYKLTRREAEASVTMFMQTLAKKNLIGLMSVGGKKSAKSKR